MICWRDVWLPDDEHHLPELMAASATREGLPTYQLKKYRRILKWVRRSRRMAIDVGAHAGLWSRNMALDFAGVAAFEPVPDYAACWRKNMRGRPHATLYMVALGAEKGTVSLAAAPGLSVNTFVDPAGQAARDRPMRPLDAYSIDDVDLIKIDVEGYEALVLQGARLTIERWKPAIIVEQKPGKAQRYGLGETEAVTLLQSWGATLRDEQAGDYFLSWD